MSVERARSDVSVGRTTIAQTRRALDRSAVQTSHEESAVTHDSRVSDVLVAGSGCHLSADVLAHVCADARVSYVSGWRVGSCPLRAIVDCSSGRPFHTSVDFAAGYQYWPDFEPPTC